LPHFQHSSETSSDSSGLRGICVCVVGNSFSFSKKKLILFGKIE